MAAMQRSRARLAAKFLSLCFVVGSVAVHGAADVGMDGSRETAAAPDDLNRGTEEEASALFDEFDNTNNVYGMVGSSDDVHYLGIQESSAACAFACVHFFLSSGGSVTMVSRRGKCVFPVKCVFPQPRKV